MKFSLYQKQLDDLDEEDHELKCHLALGFPQYDHSIGEVANHRGGHEEQEPLPKGLIALPPPPFPGRPAIIL